MHFRLVRPMKRKGSRNHQFVQRIPADIRSRIAGLKLHIPLGAETVTIPVSPKADSVRLSLRSADPSIVKRRQAEVAAYLETVWQALREDQPVPLSQKQAVALARDLYASWAEDRPTSTNLATELQADSGALAFVDDSLEEEAAPEAWEAIGLRLGGAGPDPEADDWAAVGLARGPQTDDPEQLVGPLVDRLLLRKGIGRVNAASRPLVLQAFAVAAIDAAANRQRQAGGDFTPDPKAQRFPEWESPVPAVASPPTARVSLKGLVADWWKEAEKAGRAISTYESYAATVGRLAAFLEHDDATRVTPADVVRYKDHRLEHGVSAKTVGDSDVAGLRSIFAWGVANKRLTANPADGVKVTRMRSTKTRSKELTEEEAKAVLTHALHVLRGKAKSKTHAAKRWVPWLCAYTGARLGEMVQLRKEDLRQGEGGAWIATITPEAGTVKDKEVREVVLHAHLVETGFIDFVQGSVPGYLFFTPAKDGRTRGVWRSIKNRVTEFVREVVTDPRVAPNHGWRHLFKTVGREAGIADSVLDGICGHAARTEGGRYGGVTLKAQRDAMERFPRFAVG